jgi:hypothetical protein
MNGRRILIMVMAMLLVSATVVMAQQQRNRPPHPLRMMNRVLTEAGVPLDPGQIDSIRGLEHGPDMRDKIAHILTDTQKDALRAARPERDSGDKPDFKGRRHKRPRIGAVLNDAGYPLTDEQKDAIRALERGTDKREQMHAILMPEQQAALEAAVEARKAAHLERLQSVLGEAGVPLDSGQIAAIEALGPNHRGAMGEILSATQKEALRAARPERDRGDKPDFKGRRHKRPRIGAVLNDAGYPLTDEQKDAIRALERGTDKREQMHAILMPEQLAALEAAAEARKAAHLERLLSVLTEAGVPLDPGQIAAIEALGPNHRGAMGEILSAAQKEALRAARPERGDGLGTSEPPYEDITGTEKATSVEDVAPTAFTLGQNHPNPFNPTTTIDYTLAEAGDIRVEIFNQEGQRIETLVNGWQNAGPHSLVWDASHYAAGVYLYRVTGSGFSETRKMAFVK